MPTLAAFAVAGAMASAATAAAAASPLMRDKRNKKAPTFAGPFTNAPERIRTSTPQLQDQALNLARLPIPPQALGAVASLAAGPRLFGELRLAAGLLSALLAALLRGRVARAGVRVRDLRRALLGHALLAQTLVLLVVLDRRTVIFSHADPIPGAESASTLGVAGQTVAGAGRNPRSRKVRTP